jgi:nucleotide-binding universal stress UspA family protein
VSQNALKEAVAKHRGRDVDIESALEQGEPEAVVLRMIEKVDADLVVMGTHGRRGLARAILGSVTEAVVRGSPVPVVTVHSTKSSARERSVA